jgi:uncharacterized membrane protein
VVESRRPSTVLAGPVGAVCIAGAFWLFAAAALSDAAYSASYEIQWTNFASWLIVGALVLAAIALIGAIVTIAKRRRDRAALSYFALIAAAWLVGLWSALVHARDVWATMPTGYVLSIVATVLIAIATWLAFRRERAGDVR